MKGIIYVNSTLVSERSYSEDGLFSPIHYWGYMPKENDRFYGASQQPLDILLRAYITKNIDYGIAIKVIRDLIYGFKSIYLVSMPDLLKAVPSIKKKFPDVKIVTWAWLPEELTSYYSAYAQCEHIFCLTELALKKCQEMGLNSKASLQIWGTDPSYYDCEPVMAEFDVCLLGRVGRDIQIVAEAIQKYPFSLCTTELVANRIKNPQLLSKFNVINTSTHQQVIRLLYKSRVACIPLYAGNVYPTGYTNLIESLLCGTAVVIADSSTIPTSVISLPGVYLYKTGCVKSLIEKINNALKDSHQPCFRNMIKAQASELLNGNDLTESIVRYCI